MKNKVIRRYAPLSEIVRNVLYCNKDVEDLHGYACDLCQRKAVIILITKRHLAPLCFCDKHMQINLKPKQIRFFKSNKEKVKSKW